MFKFKRKKTTHNKNESLLGVIENLLIATKASIFRLIFALALAQKVTPKRLANATDPKKTEKFAASFFNELKKKEQKKEEEVEKTLKSTTQKKK